MQNDHNGMQNDSLGGGVYISVQRYIVVSISVFIYSYLTLWNYR